MQKYYARFYMQIGIGDLGFQWLLLTIQFYFIL